MIDQITQWQVFAKRPHVMVDIEALTTSSKAPCITQIGAVYFNPDTGQTFEEFYTNVCPFLSATAGLEMDADTIKWWKKQGIAARQHTVISPASLEPAVAAQYFTDFMTKFGKDAILWGNGNTFDNVMIRSWMGHLGVKPTWSFRNDLDLRTLSGLCYATGFGEMPIPFEGTQHDGLDDAKHQVKWAVPMFQHLRGLIRDE